MSHSPPYLFKKAVSGRGETARALGQWGEKLVADDLRQKGWTVVAANFRCRIGELDVVAENEKYLAFVEVKLRKSDKFAAACEAVTLRKQRKIRAAAQYYLMYHPTGLQPRFDVAEVYAPQGTHTKDPCINYIENAF